MRKIYIFTIIMVIVVFYGCSSNTLNFSDLEPSTIVVNHDNISAIIKENIIRSSKEDITLILENKTQYEYYYGEYFNLEIELDNSWYKVPLDKNLDFKDLAIILKENSKSSDIIKLSKHFTNLPEGKYRIVKSLYLDDEETIIVAPFEIKNNKNIS
ncbi:immunoglobulin-like domain-containing protein [Clostridium tarantellae]|uniref:Bacterial Ig-like domain-containing protein n=1 Tax=Clostridium tarantellae TaxID=39493 RepID=A0A6I1MP34_9CLOT|nr:immunoglobulin-like domain-containing protein [Clostridium tarantellae]MPQ45185.1 hypothetical protein [Clostridium tarantellae]